MNRELIISVELLQTRELFLGIQGAGRPFYEFVYREAAGVYWDGERSGFKSTPLKEWSCAMWFAQIVSIVRQGLGVELVLDPAATWHGVSESDRAEILRSAI
ncbi:hypothetical protein [Rhodanobacter soli]|uniref:Integron Cassette Protein Hfx-Cass5 domain-containing protein n=1 Tax=Rhodanobacter soli TaxID=590609 RepID=A0ABV2PWP1_9GAMM